MIVLGFNVRFVGFTKASRKRRFADQMARHFAAMRAELKVAAAKIPPPLPSRAETQEFPRILGLRPKDDPSK